jgi:periplasmic protein TonB
VSYLDPPDSGRRLTGIVIVGVLHIALIYALVTGLARKVVEVIIPPLETKIIEEVKPPADKPPPPPPPKLAAPPPPFIPPPEVRIDAPAQMQNTITAVSTTKPAAEAPIRPAAPSRTAAVVEASSCAKPEYPPASLRAQETGIVVLSFLIGTDGLVHDSKVERSSGFRRLDEAARRGLGLCKFRPATIEGKPEQAWARIEYEWKIE